MDRTWILKKMNEHSWLSAAGLCVVGYLLHLLYEYVHLPKPVMALIVFVGAGIAGWAIDLIFTKSERGRWRDRLRGGDSNAWTQVDAWS